MIGCPTAAAPGGCLNRAYDCDCVQFDQIGKSVHRLPPGRLSGETFPGGCTDPW
ncbi:MAG: hypothetical protein JNK34_05980 [Tabrizicola sp.]|nr:hypothetical protein [Tabrizicola sp.]